MLCIGHRGAMGHEPENTLLSVKKALALGVDAIEIDVYNVEDNLVVIHDRDLSRTTNGTGCVEQQSFAYLRSLDAGQGEQIPTLPEVLETVDRQVTVNIELKGGNTAKLATTLILEYLERGWDIEDFVVSSFNHYELNLVKTNCPQISTGMLIYGLPWEYLTIASRLQANIVIFSVEFVTSAIVKAVHQQNLPIWVYTVNRLGDIHRMRELGVDGVFTNYPERVFNN